MQTCVEAVRHICFLNTKGVVHFMIFYRGKSGLNLRLKSVV